ncbi:MAG TPA: hypothetical protein VLO11_15650 [Luteolibacter sp.]|nr:hypothetical protein [Luteolibacter sp.]
MPLPERASSGTQPLKFHCTSCGILLTVDSTRAGTTGPCPQCGARITAPGAPHRRGTASQPASPLRKVARTHKGRVLADTGIDQAHIHNRESLQSLKVLLLFLLAFGLCFAVIWLFSR